METDSIFFMDYKYFSAVVEIPKELKRAEGEPEDEFMVSIKAQSVDETKIEIQLNSAYYLDAEPICISMEDTDIIAFAKAILHMASIRQEYNNVQAEK